MHACHARNRQGYRFRSLPVISFLGELSCVDGIQSQEDFKRLSQKDGKRLSQKDGKRLSQKDGKRLSQKMASDYLKKMASDYFWNSQLMVLMIDCCEWLLHVCRMRRDSCGATELPLIHTESKRSKKIKKTVIEYRLSIMPSIPGLRYAVKPF